jgi:triosephosphate isomerase
MTSMKPIIAANWKMHKTNTQVKEFLELLSPQSNADVWIAPPLTALACAAEYGIWVGAQNIYHEAEGAFTGEVSASQVASAGARFVIIGHSERRRLFGETQGQIEKKIQLALENNLIPLLCVGESLEERQEGKTKSILAKQLIKNFKGVIAYEPIWAIGTGQMPTDAMIEEAHAICKEICPVPVLYGGSVTASSAPQLQKIKGVDGVLVGGASLELKSFISIIEGFTV